MPEREVYQSESQAESSADQKEKDFERFEETIKNSDALFVLAHGSPPEEKLQPEARFRTMAAVEASKLNPNLRVIFVGGHLDDSRLKSTSKQMQEYFRSLAGGKATLPEFLDASNNTMGNLEEIAKFLERHKDLERVSLMSSETHLSRANELLKKLDLNFEEVPSEPFVSSRSPKHAELIANFESSPNHMTQRGINRLMLLYGKLDPDYNLVRAFRTIKRDIKSKL